MIGIKVIKVIIVIITMIGIMLALDALAENFYIEKR